MTIVFTDAALDDLRRLGPPLAKRALEQVTVLISEPEAGRPLVRGTGYRKLVGRVGSVPERQTGAWRVIYEADSDRVTVWELWFDGVRSNGAAYAEALHRMQAADTPEVVEHARVLERLGRITGTMPVPRNRVREPVPDWLADALVERAGLDRLEVAAMDAQTAFDRWNARASVGASTSATPDRHLLG